MLAGYYAIYHRERFLLVTFSWEAREMAKHPAVFRAVPRQRIITQRESVPKLRVSSVENEGT